MTSHKSIVVIGAGPTGLGAARRLSDLEHKDWLLLESEKRPGGLSRSFRDPQGFTWDIGGHVQFSHYELFDAVMLALLGREGWLKHDRESWIWMRDRFIPYPLQNNIHRLPSEDLDKCLQGLIAITRQPRSRPSNFAEWIEATFGPGLGEVFMRPYNQKVWAFPPEDMNASWVGERVAVTDLSRVLKNLVYNRDEVSWGPNNRFQFPRSGGTGAIWEACAAALPARAIQYQTQVAEINLPARKLRTSAGEEITYDSLVSTMPLRELIRICSRNDLMPLAERGLLYSSVNVIGLGLKGCPSEQLSKKCWMYFPEGNCPFYRATVFSHYAEANVPDPTRHWSLMFEVSESPKKLVDQSSLIEDVIQGAVNTGLIHDHKQVISKWVHRAAYGYPTPGLYRDEVLAELIPEFERWGVYSRGRFGMWKYEVSNQDHSFMQGVEIVERLLNGGRERTAFDPDFANSKKHVWPFRDQVKSERA